jgi:hypothetical protein
MDFIIMGTSFRFLQRESPSAHRLMRCHKYSQQYGKDARRRIKDLRPGVKRAFAAFPLLFGQGPGLCPWKQVILASVVCVRGNYLWYADSGHDSLQAKTPVFRRFN